MGHITLKSVQKTFVEADVIPAIDLTIQDGEFAVFVGPSGCGKSTLLRLIAGLEDVTAGNIQIDGVNATDIYDKIISEVERPLIKLTLAATRGNQIKAAAMLGLNRNTLRKKIRDLEIPVVRGLM